MFVRSMLSVAVVLAIVGCGRSSSDRSPSQAYAARPTVSASVTELQYDPHGSVDLAAFWANARCRPLKLVMAPVIDKSLAERLFYLKNPPVGDGSAPKSRLLVAYEEARARCYPAYLGRATMLFMGRRWQQGFVAYNADAWHNRDPRVDGAWDEMERGIAAGAHGDLTRAVEQFKAAISEANGGAAHGKGLFQAHFLLAMAYSIQGRKSDAGAQLLDVLSGDELPIPDSAQYGPPPEWIAALRLFYGPPLETHADNVR